MKSGSFIFDRRLYELLKQERHAQFSTRTLRDAYAQSLQGNICNLSQLRQYVYDQIRRMLRVGWITPAPDRRKRGQIYHLGSLPEGLHLELVEEGFKSSPQSVPLKPYPQDEVMVELSPMPDIQVLDHLESLLKELRLEFLTSMGEAERFKQLFDEMPHLKNRVEGDYFDARDRSSRLLGHVRAVEKTLKTFASK